MARKWRPRTFREMVGQEHVLRALINALDHNRLHHAYLFTGTRGVGKTTIARILAKCLNCETGVSSEPCGKCSACTEIGEGRFVDLIEVDAASRTKVEDTRELLDNVQYAPTRGRFKIYLIDEVHMLSNHSFNALLKTLEEPPEHVKFLLATTDPQKLPVTILSRCLQFNLKNMSAEQVVEHLRQILKEEVIPFEDAGLWQLARSADGSMRDALSLTDQAIAFGSGKVLEAEVSTMLGTIDYMLIQDIVNALVQSDGAAILAAVAKFAEHAPDYSAALADLLTLLHRVAIAQALPESLDNSYGDRTQILNFAQQLAPEDVQLFYQTALMGRRDLSLASNPRSGFEMTLLRMLAFKPQGVADIPSKPLAVSSGGSLAPNAGEALVQEKKPLAPLPSQGNGQESAAGGSSRSSAIANILGELGEAQEPGAKATVAKYSLVGDVVTSNAPAMTPETNNKNAYNQHQGDPQSTPQAFAPDTAPDATIDWGDDSPSSKPPEVAEARGQVQEPHQAAQTRVADTGHVPSDAPPWAEDTQAAAHPAAQSAVPPVSVTDAGPSGGSVSASSETVSSVPQVRGDANESVTERLKRQVSEITGSEGIVNPARKASLDISGEATDKVGHTAQALESQEASSVNASYTAEERVQKIPLVEFGPERWIEVFQQLKIKGILLSTAANCVCVGGEANNLHFVLDDAKGSLFDQSHASRLADMLTDYFAEPVRVEINLGLIPEGIETPAVFELRRKAERKAAAIVSLNNDPVVQRLQSEFGAVLNEDSIAFA